jgi:hypothetical protein
LLESIVLGISKITDNPKSSGKKNFTVNAIPQFISDDVIKKEIEKDIKEIIEIAKSCRKRRNKKIAHLDLDIAVNSISIDPILKSEIDAIINGLQNIYNKIENYYFNTETAFQYITSSKGAFSLLKFIENCQ